MQTVDKAMKLLGYFSPSAPEIGLSELARLATFDKAATRRFLVALSKHGFIEQNLDSKKYRLGPAFLRFARLREATHPFPSMVQPELDRLATATMETAHASLINGFELMTIGISEPQRTIRAHLEPSQPLPMHATASGIACLAFLDDEAVEGYISQARLERFTDSTVTSKKELRRLIGESLKRGYGRAAGTFESDVIGTAVPLFDDAVRPIGAIAVAAVASRFDTTIEQQILPRLFDAAIRLTLAFGGQMHPTIARAREAFSDK